MGKGTAFKLYFPRVSEPASDLRGDGAPQLARQGGETILVVEDEQGVRELTTKMLKRMGYHVLAAAGGAEALALAGGYAGHIALVVTDVVMPNMSGRQLARELRRRRPDMNILFISGYTENTISQHDLLEDGAAFLAKPFSGETLARKVREALAGRRAEG